MRERGARAVQADVCEGPQNRNLTAAEAPTRSTLGTRKKRG